ncbi:MAG TPA: PspC domain-containing protein [Chitinophagaceae bacterium]|nr:PspC domain-containing protein [Chitinophagaceae bacterium]
MKKIININLSGLVIPIEDSAYEQLQGYIESLRRYFAHEEGRDEIINDIESRMAELMGEKIRKGASCITEADIQEMIASMGRPEDFDEQPEEKTGSYRAQDSAEGATQAGPGPAYEYTGTRKRNRLFRDSSDKVIGGVCSGLANYLNVDPAIMRLLFAIITFGGFGAGILIYLLLWIILPERDLEQFGGKRLYRNPEERILGGVCSGIAAYFNKDTNVIRLIFAAPLLLNVLLSALSWPFFHGGAVFPNIVFGSLTGTFILAYIVLWIVLPEARSQYQKMEMRGERVDVNTIRQNVKEGMGQMKDRARDFGEEVKQSAQKLGAQAKEFASTRGASWGKEIGEAGARVGTSIGHVIGVLFKAFFLFVAGTIAFALFVVLMALIFGGVGAWPLKNYVLSGFWQNMFAWGTLLFFLGVPLVAFITWLVRRMMRVRSQNRYLGWMFGGLWTLGWICASLLAASIGNDFRRNEKVASPVDITQPPTGRMVIRVSEPEVRYSGNLWWLNSDESGWDINEDSLRMANVKIRIEKSEDSNYHVELWKYAAGRDGSEATDRARNIRYHLSYADSVLNLGSGLTVSKDDHFRLQRIIVDIRVPAGRRIRFDESVDLLHPFEVRVYERQRWQRNQWNVDWDWDNYFDWETNVDYVMGQDGQLVNPANPPRHQETADTGNYRYPEKDRIRQDIREREQRIQEDQRRLDEEKRRLREDSLRQHAALLPPVDPKPGEQPAASPSDLPASSLLLVLF